MRPCVIEARRLDIVITDKRKQSGIIVDIAVPADGRVHEKDRAQDHRVTLTKYA